MECPALRPMTPMRKAALAGLLGPGDLVAVPIEPQRAEGPRAEQPHHGPPPGVVDPALGLVFQRRGGRRLDSGQLLALLGQAVDHLQRRVLAQDPEHLALVPRPHVEDQRAPGLGPGGVGRHRPGVDAVGTAGELLALEAQRLRPVGRGQLRDCASGATTGRWSGSARRGTGRPLSPSIRPPLAVPAGSRVSEMAAMACSAPSQFMEWVAQRAMASMSR